MTVVLLFCFVRSKKIDVLMSIYLTHWSAGTVYLQHRGCKTTPNAWDFVFLHTVTLTWFNVIEVHWVMFWFTPPLKRIIWLFSFPPFWPHRQNTFILQGLDNWNLGSPCFMVISVSTHKIPLFYLLFCSLFCCFFNFFSLFFLFFLRFVVIFSLILLVFPSH